MTKESKIDEDMLMKYINEGLTQKECAKRLNVNPVTVRRWMKRNEIEYKFTNVKNLVGNRYGRLVVIKQMGGKNGKTTWLCRCDCGNEKEICGSSLTKEYGTRSCGCLAKEVIAERNISNGNKNGATLSSDKRVKRLISIYNGMRNRCYNEKSDDYKDYGGRGIKIDDEWLGDSGFENFKNWALKNGYDDELTIDRINVDDNYKANNCKWATPLEQANNTRKNVFLTINGESKTLAQWSRILNINPLTLRYRYKKSNDFNYLTRPTNKKGDKDK